MYTILSLLTWVAVSFPALSLAGVGADGQYNAVSQSDPTDWAQPPVGCVEEVMPQMPSYPCLDLTSVQNPTRDLPSSLTPDEVTLWTRDRKRALVLCRAQEILRRESLHPGGIDPGWVEASWMRMEGVKETDEKIAAIYEGTNLNQMPPQILLGALMQESMMADLGISSDGGNYSCGIAQLNVLEWCHWAEHADPDIKNQIGWPARKAGMCSAPLLSTKLVEPFFKYGLAHLNGVPAYKMKPKHLEGIRLADVIGSFPAGSSNDQKLRFEIVQSFVKNCSSYRFSIPAKAHVLKAIFDHEIPSAFHDVQTYTSGGFARPCRNRSTTNAYPLHSGWLLADAIYNAGSRIVDVVAHYRKLDRAAASNPATWAEFYPQDLVSALYWGGKYNRKTDRLDSIDLEGNPFSMTWFKSCIVQRHVARVVQYVTLPGYDLVRSLEDKNGCAKSTFDSEGNLIKSSVPLERQRSSGQIGAGSR